MADLLLLLLMFSTWKSMRTAKDIGLLADRITAILNGDLTTYLALPKDADLCRAAEELGDIQSGMEKALAERTQSERMKVEIVADGGSGLGLSIAASFTEACGGVFTVETLADLFTAKVTFPLAAEQSKAF